MKAVVVALAAIGLGVLPSQPSSLCASVVARAIGPIQGISVSSIGGRVAVEMAGAESEQGVYLLMRRDSNSTVDGTGRLSMLVRGARDFEWKPDGRGFVFARKSDKAPDGGHAYALWTGRCGSRKYTRVAYGWMGCWSPDGSKIAYVRSGSLYEVTIETGRNRVLLNSGARPSDAFDPVWSPDGRVIYFSRADGRLWALALKGDGLHPIVPKLQGADDQEPAVSPNGRYVAFTRGYYGSVSSVEGQPIVTSRQILVLDRHTGRLLRLTARSEHLSDTSPQWLSGSERIMFVRTSSTDGSTQIMSAELK